MPLRQCLFSADGVPFSNCEPPLCWAKLKVSATQTSIWLWRTFGLSPNREMATPLCRNWPKPDMTMSSLHLCSACLATSCSRPLCSKLVRLADMRSKRFSCAHFSKLHLAKKKGEFAHREQPRLDAKWPALCSPVVAPLPPLVPPSTNMPSLHSCLPAYPATVACCHLALPILALAQWALPLYLLPFTGQTLSVHSRLDSGHIRWLRSRPWQTEPKETFSE